MQKIRFVVLAAIIFLLALAAVTQATVINVPADQPTIQAGVDSASAGDTVLVVDESYSGPGNEAISIRGKAITLKSTSGPDSTILYTSDTVRTMIIDSIASGVTVIDGFTITAGFQSGFAWDSAFRGGIEIVAASVTLKNCVISGCYGEDGGGLHVADGIRTTIDSCTFANNFAANGGSAVFAERDTVEINFSTIEDNWSNGFYGTIHLNTVEATVYQCHIQRNRLPIDQQDTGGSFPFGIGGGISSRYGSVDIDSCVIANNSAFSAGGVYCTNGDLTMTYNTIYNNLARGGAAVVIQPSGLATQTVFIDHNSFVCNYSSGEMADGVWLGSVSFSGAPAMEGPVEDPGSHSPMAGDFAITNNQFAFSTHAAIGSNSADVNPIILYNNVWYPVSGNRYSGLIGDQTGTNGNISADPLLCDITANNLTLDASSPCVGEGQNGSDIGAFGVGCDMYAGGSPEKISVLGMDSDDSLGFSNDSVVAVMSRAAPWDTVYFESRYYLGLDQVDITVPLYFMGNGMDSTLMRGYGVYDALINATDFCVMSGFRAERYDSTADANGVILCSDYPSILVGCDARGYAMTDTALICGVQVVDASVLIRGSAMSGGTIASGSCYFDLASNLDCMVAHNYWFGEANQYRGVFDTAEVNFQHRAFYDPMLGQYPTDVSDGTAETVPASYHLSQNYPNPFNPKTTIAFDLPKRGRVTLTVFNILGQTVETLCDRTFPAGSHSVDWNAEHSATGVYFYRFETAESVETRKMLLLK